MSKTKGAKLHTNVSDIHKFFTGDFEGEPRIQCVARQTDHFAGKKIIGTIIGILETSSGIYLKVKTSKARIKVKDGKNYKYALGRCVTIVPLDFIESIYTVKILSGRNEAPVESEKEETEETIEVGEDHEEDVD